MGLPFWQPRPRWLKKRSMYQFLFKVSLVSLGGMEWVWGILKLRGREPRVPAKLLEPRCVDLHQSSLKPHAGPITSQDSICGFQGLGCIWDLGLQPSLWTPIQHVVSCLHSFCVLQASGLMMFRPCSPDPEAKILEPVIVILPKVVNDSTINNNTQEKETPFQFVTRPRPLQAYT